jgi:hypothetical protein
MPHKNAELLETFYKSLRNNEHQKIANCYHQDATFTDIAFNIEGRKHIHAMWHMICQAKVELKKYDVESANERTGSASWVAGYMFDDNGTKRKVHNELKSSFEFKDGLIIKQTDDCNVRNWATQALGPVKGLAAWLIPGLRHATAKRKLRSFIDQHPEYAPPPP